MPTRKAQKRGVETRQQLPPEQRGALLRTLKARFEKNMNRHHGLQWTAVQARLEANPENFGHSMRWNGRVANLTSLVTTRRRAIRVLRLFSGKPQRPPQCVLRPGSAGGKKGTQAEEQRDGYGGRQIEILTEAQYRELQTLGDFDTKTSSWVKTPPDIRERGGAIFCDRRYDHVFTYHNGAESYYAARAFRGALKV